MARIRYLLALALLGIFLVGCVPQTGPGTDGKNAVSTTVPTLRQNESSTAGPNTAQTPAAPTASAEVQQEQTPELPGSPQITLEPTPLKTLPTNPKDKPDFGTVAPAPVLPAHTPGTQVDIVKQATEDLARRLGLKPDQVQWIGTAPDEFPASDLGCLAPGQTPLPNQGLVTGRSITLEAEGERYLYRSHGGLVVYCGQR